MRRVPLHRFAVIVTLAIAGGLATLAWAGPSVGLRSIVVSGGSMEPAIPIGSLLIAEQVAPAELEPGEVIVFRAAGEVVTHRIVAVSATDAGPVFVTQGDANASPDPDPVAASAVIGRSVATVPFAGYAAVALRTPWAWLTLIATLIALEMVVAIVRAPRPAPIRSPVEGRAVGPLTERLAAARGVRPTRTGGRPART